MIVLLLVPFILFRLFKRLFAPNKLKQLSKRHVVITGGSSGIGKSAAKIAAKYGANVTIIARNLDRLNEAVNEIREGCEADQIISSVSVDVSNKNEITKELLKLEESVGPIYMLINCAGMAICGTVEEFSEHQINTLLNANYLGTLYAIQAIVPRFKARKEGKIVLTSSSVGLMGMYGYSIYSSFKFALRGLAESIAMELKPFNVSITLALPPDTDTPGFENENKTKPEETKLISEAGGLVKPEQVALRMLQDAMSGHFFSFVGMESYILTNLCIGMSPFTSFLDVLIQATILGPLRLIASYYIKSFESIVQKCHLKKLKNH